MANVSDVVYDASNVLRSGKSKVDDFDEDEPFAHSNMFDDETPSITASLDDLDREDNRLLASEPEAVDGSSTKSGNGNRLNIRQRLAVNKNSINSTPTALESQLNDDEAL